jgi:hypothetical protein
LLYTDILTANPEYKDIDTSNILFKFNTVLEDMAALASDVNEFYKRSKSELLANRLRKYLEYIRLRGEELNPVDRKSYMDYYIESRAVLVSNDTWHKGDEEIEDSFITTL